jgi:hypothetical protein
VRQVHPGAADVPPGPHLRPGAILGPAPAGGGSRTRRFPATRRKLGGLHHRTDHPPRETRLPHSTFYYWRTAAGQEIDLLVERPTERIGVEIKLGTHIAPSGWRTLRYAFDALKLARAYVVNQTDAPYHPFPGIQVLPAERLLGSSRWNL